MTQRALFDIPGLVDEADGTKENDYYPTPRRLCEAICRRLQRTICPTPGAIIEPSAGSGNFLRAAAAVWPAATRYAYEVDPRHRPELLRLAHSVAIGDWLTFAPGLRTYAMRRPRLFIGNVPFSVAQAHVEAALDAMMEGDHLALVFKLDFLGTQARSRTLWARLGLLHLLPFGERPDFSGEGGDSHEYATFIWRHGYTGACSHLPHLWLEEIMPLTTTPTESTP